MKKCPLTYEPLKSTKKIYSPEGLKKLNPRLKDLAPFPYTRAQQIKEAQRLATKLSIQGVQPKLSAKLNVHQGTFEIAPSGGTFIIKPQVDQYPHLPENEDLTMHLAGACGIEVPWHGLIFCADGTYSYVIKRFDRLARGEKVPLEDFAQLTGATREIKYEVPIEKCVEVLFEHCTYPTLEGVKLLQRLVFSFIVGNEDLHLKNLSLITKGGKVALSPGFDFVNSTIVLPGSKDELALSLDGKKRGFTREDFVQNFALKNELMNQKTAEKVIDELLTKISQQNSLIKNSFLSDHMKEQYIKLIKSRTKRLEKRHS